MRHATARRDHGRAQLACVAHQGAGLDAERLGRVAGSDRHRALGQRLHDDYRLAAQGRVFLLLARPEEGVEVGIAIAPGFRAWTYSSFVLYNMCCAGQGLAQRGTSAERLGRLRLDSEV